MIIIKFTDEQLTFLNAEGKNIIRACPGSGKTYMVANKFIKYINEWKFYHQGVAVLSFTNVASKEIIEKIEFIEGNHQSIKYPHFIGTVDSFINEFIVLRYGYLSMPQNKRPLLSLTDNWKLPFKYWRSECHRNRCVEHIEKFRYGIDGAFYKGKDIVTCKLNEKQSTLPCQQYKKMLASKSVVFQNETALLAARLLKKYPVIAKGLAERFPVIIIDEAQDTSAEQMEVFDLLSTSGITSIFLVGDPDQAIYEWRDATPDCFIRKMEDRSWNTIKLTGNFRSSQNICNATCYFSQSVNTNIPNKAIGTCKGEIHKPILLLTEGNNSKEVDDFFLLKCKEMNIDIQPDKVAILTRGRINVDTDIAKLWKSKELEEFAQSRYEWEYGSRKKAISIASKAAFCIFYGELLDNKEMQDIIDDSFGQSAWLEYIIILVSDAPCVQMSIGEWVNQFKTHFLNVSAQYDVSIDNNRDIKDIFKIKTRDKTVPNFKDIEVSRFFEKKRETYYTRSSIHGVKGETFDAVLLHIKSKTGNTLTPSFLEKGDLNTELMRIAYVAMTRPRRLLVVAMPKNSKIKEYQRFPRSLWEYEILENDKIKFD